jgi:molybdopterin/thiamine biosynthesis adenylyltransferase
MTAQAAEATAAAAAAEAFQIRPTLPEDFDRGPTLIDATDPAAEAKLRELVSRRRPKFVIDSLEEQLAEVFFIRNPSADARSDNTRRELARFVREHVPDPARPWAAGTWAYFPWNDHLVRYLPEDMHFEVRTSRNRELVSRPAQVAFYEARVAIAGLSVGNNITLTMALAGGPKHMRLADPDVMSASNLNRIRRPVSTVGRRKVVVASQEIYEINPYAELETFPDGLSDANIDRFLTHPEPVDVVVAVMDSAPMQIALRLAAKRLRLPFVMGLDIGDSGFIDVERFDLDPHRPPFHGKFTERELRRVSATKDPVDLVRFFTQAGDLSRLDPGFMRSVPRVLRRELAGWPQLAGTVALTSAMVCYAVRRIILNEPLAQGGRTMSLDDALDPTYLTPYAVEERLHEKNNFQRFLGL